MENPFNILRKKPKEVGEFRHLITLSRILETITETKEKYPINKKNGKEWIAFSKMLSALSEGIKNESRRAINE